MMVEFTQLFHERFSIELTIFATDKTDDEKTRMTPS